MLIRISSFSSSRGHRSINHERLKCSTTFNMLSDVLGPPQLPPSVVHNLRRSSFWPDVFRQIVFQIDRASVSSTAQFKSVSRKVPFFKKCKSVKVSRSNISNEELFCESGSRITLQSEQSKIRKRD